MNHKLKTFFASAIVVCAGAATTFSAAPKVGGLVMAGDPAFDSDSIASAELQERRWLSYPGGRLCLNPATARKFEQSPMGADLALNIGGYLGTGVLRLDNVVDVRLDAAVPVSRSTTWYPYQISFQAKYANGAEISGRDFFADANSTLIRSIEVRGGDSKELVLGGKSSSPKGARWDATREVIVVEDAKYIYALRLLAGATKLKPAVGKEAWSVRIPLGAEMATVTIGFGFAAASEGGDAAIARACGALARPVSESLAAAKATMDAYLRKVPQPTRWGIESIPAYGVTPEQQRQAYYAAWSLVIQSIMNPFPENAAYPLSADEPRQAFARGPKANALRRPRADGRVSSACSGSRSWSRRRAGRPTKASCRGSTRTAKLGGESLAVAQGADGLDPFKQQPDRAAAQRRSIRRSNATCCGASRIPAGSTAATTRPTRRTSSSSSRGCSTWTMQSALPANWASPTMGAVAEPRRPQMRKNLHAVVLQRSAGAAPVLFHEHERFTIRRNATSDRPIMILTALWLKDLLPADARDGCSVCCARFISRNAPPTDSPTRSMPTTISMAYGLIDRRHGRGQAVRRSVRARLDPRRRICRGLAAGQEW